jgi:hypothetical protein
MEKMTRRQSRTRVLLVGGDPRTVKELARAVRQADVPWALDAVAGPAEVASRLDQTSPNLIFLGSDPTREPIRAFLENLRPASRFRRVATIALLAAGKEIELSPAYEAGMTSCVEWPRTPGEQENLIRAAEAYWSLHFRGM